MGAGGRWRDGDVLFTGALLPPDAGPIDPFDRLGEAMRGPELVDGALTSLLGVIVDDDHTAGGDLPVQRIQHVAGGLPQAPPIRSNATSSIAARGSVSR